MTGQGAVSPVGDARNSAPFREPLPHYVKADLPVPRPTRWTPALDARLMEAVANGSSFSAAGRLLGLNKDQACTRFAHIRRSMGSQAR
jgi:hypothetical protein